MRLRSPGALLLLLGTLHAADGHEQEVRALVGSDVELGCVFPESHTFDLDDLYVYWQISVMGHPTTVTYYLSGNASAGLEDNRYRDRAWLSLESMKRGDFSLHLYNITPQDEQKFNCLVFRKSLQLKKILDVVVTMHVAANYSMPVVSALSGPSEDKLLTFTCTSVNGYPKPNVYWINKTDNSMLPEDLQNSTVSLNARGLYDVVSVLRIRQTPSVNVGCCIENVLLHQNLTGIGQAGKVPRGLRAEANPRLWASGDSEHRPLQETATESGNTGSHTDDHRKDHGTVLSTLAVLGVVVVVAAATGWVCRSRCPHGILTRRWAARPEQAFSECV
ncbi:ICOS ligand isoform X2 [Ursus maritimus]|uniref:ICOS ligand n=1 Tax=Ursus maritimus TaxID=29073 RepID=A0A8M1F6K3_URSMA|nr:ICOS ligand isoform X1 [Ursus maritimus]XP_040477775.1 ICOS ligand isoform X2 [Ursus maritimus]